MAAGAIAFALQGGDEPVAAPEAAAPVRVELPPENAGPENRATIHTDADGPDAGDPTSGEEIPPPLIRTARPAPSNGQRGAAGGSAPASAAPAADAGATSGGGRPVVWVQAGHADPREPGYRDQTGASSGPFGSEIGFTTTLAPKVIADLRAAGVDARQTPGEVTPWGARGAVFVSLHHDTPEGRMAIGHAIAGAGENWYHGEGSGTASPTPYPDSAPHRDATTVSGAVESRSTALASALAAELRPIYTPANGAGASFGGVEPRDGNPRMMRYYGYYRTRADARVLVEFGAGSTDDAFLAKTDVIATALSAGVVDHLRARGDLR